MEIDIKALDAQLLSVQSFIKGYEEALNWVKQNAVTGGSTGDTASTKDNVPTTGA